MCSWTHVLAEQLVIIFEYLAQEKQPCNVTSPSIKNFFDVYISSLYLGGM